MEVGIEVVGVGREFFAKGSRRPVRVPCKEERLPQVGLKRGQASVQRLCFGEFGDGARIISICKQGGPEEKMAFRRIAPPQNTIYTSLPLGDPAVADQGSSQDVVEGWR